MKKFPAIFLDRDGVINENRANYVRRWADVEIFPQALTALAKAAASPYKIIVVTNQSAVGRGIITLAQANEINQRLLAEVRQHGGRVDAAYICPAAPHENAPCRKPQPGMLQQAAADHALDLSQSYMVGDALTDIAAGRNAGVQAAFLVRTGRGLAQLQLPQAQQHQPLMVFDDLTAVIDHILAA